MLIHINSNLLKMKKGNQEAVMKLALKSLMPSILPITDMASISDGTTGTSGSGNDLSGDNSALKKRYREKSQDGSNPGKKLNDKMSPKKSSNEDDVSNVESNLTEKELSQHIVQVSLRENNTAVSYAAAASKPKFDLPNLVYFQKGIKHREPVQKVHYDAFMKTLLEVIMKLPEEQSANINIDWHGYGLGRGVIACLNPVSANFVKQIASGFSIGDLKFRAWSKNEFGNREIFSGLLSGILWKERKPLDTVKWIFHRNGLKNHAFHLLSYKKTSEGVLFRFEASKELSLALRQLNYVLNAGILNVRLEHKNADSSPTNLPEKALNLEQEGKNKLQKETVEKQL